MRLQNEGNLIAFVLRIIINMGMSNNSPFYYKYKKSDLSKAIEYCNSLAGYYPIHLADIANEI